MIPTGGVDGLSSPALFLLAFLVPFVTVLVVTPFLARLARRIGLLDHPAPNKPHPEATPYLGGVAVAAGLVIVGTVVAGASVRALVIVTSALVLAVLGLIDDWRTVRPWVKVLVESGAGVLLWVGGVRAGLFGVPALDLAATVVWIVAVANAVNLLDNADGVASAVAAIAALGFFAIAASAGALHLAALAIAIAGASLAFLRYNFPPARIFLGDAGSLMIGVLLGAVGLLLVGSGGVSGTVVPLLILALPLFDMVLVVVARIRDGRSVLAGGTDHTAHRLTAHGVSSAQLVLLAAGVQVVCSAVAFVLFQASQRWVLIGAGIVSVTALAAFATLIRLEPPEATIVLPEVEEPDRDRARGRSVPAPAHHSP